MMAERVQSISNDPASNMQRGARVALGGMMVNVVLAAAKISAGLFGNSYVLIADGIESALDIAGLVAMGVLLASIALAIQSVREIFTPHHGPAPFTLVVLIVVIVVKEFLYRVVIRVGKDVESTAVKTDAWHHRADALTSTAAFLGISVALVGGEKWYSADDWAALFACAVIAMNGWKLLFPALHEMLDTAPRGEIVETIQRAAASVPGVLNVEKCLVRKMGISFYVDLHAGVDGRISVRDGHAIAHQVKDAIKQTDRRIADVLVHVEPA